MQKILIFTSALKILVPTVHVPLCWFSPSVLQTSWLLIKL